MVNSKEVTDSPQNVRHAALTWKGDVPFSEKHQDVYFSQDNGLEESRYVFLRGNQIEERLRNRSADSTFTIAESGFGTGLNFIATWLAWRQLPMPRPALYYISFEKYPLTRTDLEHALSSWPGVEELSEALRDAYPPLISGRHTLCFEHGKVRLGLVLGDINEALPQQVFKADAWYLDGFSPSKNPSMWTDLLFEEMARHSHLDTTFATFSAAGFVRRGLARAGFAVSKVPGFGRKREMLTGYMTEARAMDKPEPEPLWPYSHAAPVNTQPHITTGQTSKQYDIAIIGAGLAGICVAALASEKGLRIALIEKSTQLLGGASGQSQLAMYAKLPAQHNKELRLLLHGLSYSQSFFKRLQARYPDTPFWHPTGLMQLAWNEKERQRQDRLLNALGLPADFMTSLNSLQASEKSGLDVETSALWFPRCGWLDPKIFAQQISNSKNIEIFTGQRATQISQEDDSNWLIQTHGTAPSSLIARQVVVANANELKTLLPDIYLPLKPLRGQVTTLYNPELPTPNCVVCGEGYLCPGAGYSHHIGATYDLENPSPIVTAQDNLKNIDSVQRWLPNWLKNKPEAEKMEGSAGLRCTLPDYQPVAGKLFIESKMRERFAPIRDNAKACNDTYGDYFDNFFLSVGHGSKGLITAPICAELIISKLSEQPAPFSDELERMVSPARFLIKDLIKKKT